MSISEEQVSRLLALVGMPESMRQQCDDLTYLRRLMRLYMQAVPFGSLALHYSPQRFISLNVEDLFEKIVERGHGGYCMEMNNLFATLLRALGFTVVTVGGRITQGQGLFSGPTHMTIIVVINGERYLVDVGYGASAPFQPVPMIKASPVDSFPIIGTRRGKLEFRSVALHTDPSQRVWLYSVQENADSAWVEQYAMTDQELALRDYEVMNYFTSTHPRAFFVQNVVLVKIVCSDVEGDDFAPTQLITLFRERLRFNTPGGDDKLVVLASEEERVAAMEEQFGIKLTRRERESILGYATAIAPKKSTDASPGGV